MLEQWTRKDEPGPPAPAPPSSTAGVLPDPLGRQPSDDAPLELEGFLSLSAPGAAAALDAAAAALDGKGVVVVGGGLDALSACRELLDRGVAAGDLTLACPAAGLETLGDSVVDRVAERALKAAGVQVLYDLELSALVRESAGNALTAARFSPKGAAGAPAPALDDDASWPGAAAAASPPKPPVVDVPCGLVVGAAAHDVAPDMFLAINESGLVCAAASCSFVFL